MTEELKGAVVRALAGHDSGTLYCVVDTEGDFLLLADGKTRRLARLKRKRRKHVELTGKTVSYETDGALRRSLAVCRDELLRSRR